MEITLLDPIETNVENEQREKIRDWNERTDKIGKICRHRKSANKRHKIAEALDKSGEPLSRGQNFRNCGAYSWVWRKKNEPDKYRIKCTKCHDRFCTQCSFERGRMYARTIAGECVEGRTRFITLTLRHSDDPLSYQLDTLYKSYRKLRQRQCWKCSQEKSIAFTEITYNLEKRQFHCHLHILSVGSYLDQKILSQAWLSITKDSFIVDIRLVHNSRQAAQYVCKYAAKGISANVLLESNKAEEVIQALKGRRLIIGSGSWRKIEPEKDTLVRSEWEQVGTLGGVIQLASEGDCECKHILDCLHISEREAMICISTVQLNSS